MILWNKIIFLFIIILHICGARNSGHSTHTGRVMRQKFKTSKGVIPPAPPGPPLESAPEAELGCNKTLFTAASFSGTGFITAAKRWHNPIGSKFYYYNMAEVMANRSLGPGELDFLCLNYVFFPSTTGVGGRYATVIGAFNAVSLSLSCLDNQFVQEKCDVLRENINQKMAENVGTIIATDSENYFLMARCVQEKYRDWALFTTDKHFSLPPTLMQSLAAKLTENGFSLDNTLFAKYESCNAMGST